jgi:hypothetical protein
MPTPEEEGEAMKQKKNKKNRNLNRIIEEAFEAGFLSMLGPYVFRAPDAVELDEDETSESSHGMLPRTEEITLS